MSAETPETGRKPGSVRLATFIIVVLIAIPSKLIFAPLGSAGTPAQIAGLVVLALWIVTRLLLPSGARTRQPLQLAMIAFVASILTSYVAANVRPIERVEVSAADRGLLSALAWLGMFLAFSDGLANRAQLLTVLRRLSYAGGAVAALGLFQFATKLKLVDKITIPGLTLNGEIELDSRGGGLVRAVGTAIHAIEFGAVLTTILPIAIHFAMTDDGRSRFARWWPVVAIMAAIPMSISRSAIVATVVVMAFLLPTFSPGVRSRALALMAMLGVVLYVTVPGLAGTFRSLFTGISEDTSTTSRTDSYNLAWDFIWRAPVFGRGFRTFLPSYRILDNQYLNILIETGFVGLCATLTLFAMGVGTGLSIRRSTSDPVMRSLGVSLAASVAAGTLCLALYDGFSFPMAASLIFITLGATAAARRILAEERSAASGHAIASARTAARPYEEQLGAIEGTSDQLRWQ